MSHNVRATPVRREHIDIDKLAAGLLLLAQQVAAENAANGSAPPTGESGKDAA